MRPHSRTSCAQHAAPSSSQSCARAHRCAVRRRRRHPSGQLRRRRHRPGGQRRRRRRRPLSGHLRRHHRPRGRRMMTMMTGLTAAQSGHGPADQLTPCQPRHLCAIYQVCWSHCCFSDCKAALQRTKSLYVRNKAAYLIDVQRCGHLSALTQLMIVCARAVAKFDLPCLLALQVWACCAVYPQCLFSMAVPC